MQQDEYVRSTGAASLPGSFVDIPAILGGAVVAAALTGVFTTFGGAMGLGTLSAEPGQGSFGLWMFVTALWIVATLIGSFMAGAYVTGRLRRRVETATADEISMRDGLNGLIVWGLGTLVAGWMLAGAVSGTLSVAGSVASTAVTAAGSAAGGLVSGLGTAAGGVVSGLGTAAGGAVSAAGSALGGAVQGLGAAAGAATDDADTDGIMTYLTETLLRPAIDGAQTSAQAPVGTPQRPALDDAALARQVGIVLGNVLRTGEISDADKNFMIGATAQRTGVPRAEVEAKVEETVQKVVDMRAEAEAALEAAAAEAERMATEAMAEAERMAAEAKAEAERMAEEAKQAAIDAAETARKSAILTAFLLAAAAVVAAGASVIGAVIGGRHRDENRLFGGFTYR